ncbi:MAG TPA: A/G-specific adenine glycosylase [Opitutaceae bacterium]|jgi:A/G-specific adenine glycosylase|nr:A/G-specific adenine glycosylase [Opitutaceae bacterium]
MTRKSSGQSQLASKGAGFRKALIGWYQASRRRLPWRERPSAYSTVVSEFMLQQTQVSTVLPYFARWMETLPDFKALAGAPESQVLKLWEGLGYYSRARNLHKLAKAVASGGVPRTAEGWRELPGVGPYTAAAISSIAFGVPQACVDGNVVRILSRLTADATPFRDSASASKAFAPLAQEVMNHDEPGDHNQAMMELGATVCLRRKPLCLTCPVLKFCAAAAAGGPENYPVLEAKKTEHREVVRVWCESAGSVLFHRNASGARRLADIHELPTAEQAGMDPLAVSQGKLVARKTRSITRYRIVESIHAAILPKGKILPGLVWIPIKELGEVSLSGPHRKWTTEVLVSARS